VVVVVGSEVDVATGDVLVVASSAIGSAPIAKPATMVSRARKLRVRGMLMMVSPKRVVSE
jgi:hypothetical protein